MAINPDVTGMESGDALPWPSHSGTRAVVGRGRKATGGGSSRLSASGGRESAESSAQLIGSSSSGSTSSRGSSRSSTEKKATGRKTVRKKTSKSSSTQRNGKTTSRRSTSAGSKSEAATTTSEKTSEKTESKAKRTVKRAKRTSKRSTSKSSAKSKASSASERKPSVEDRVEERVDQALDDGGTQFRYQPDSDRTVVTEYVEPAHVPALPRAEQRPQAPIETPPLAKGGRQMLINASSGEECRIAVVDDRRLEEIFIERQSAVSHVGNIYKGVITNVEAGIQAAFVDFGLPKHGFLHISDVQPQYFGDRQAEPEGVGQKTPRRERPPIQKCFRRGQEVIVQVTKEGLGTKGPTLSTYLSIPGRFLVMMPGMAKLGVSRKITDEDVRRKMRSVLDELKLPKSVGFILRTAGQDRNKRELQRDLNYLVRLWKNVSSRVRSANAPAELYRESDLVVRTLRDVFTPEFDQIIVDSPSTADRVRDFLRIATPRTPQKIVQVYQSPVPVFHHYGIEQQIEAIHSRHVPLPSGGSLVIESTEAMVTIDVNSGRLKNSDDEEGTAFQTNKEAASEIARQLRLRDLGGLIVCDFIDMRFDRNKRAIERALRDELKKHKERARILRMSQFGLIEMTRQRQGPSIKRGVYNDCPHCKGSGLVKSPESMTLHVLRNIQMAVHRADVVRLGVHVAPDVAFQLQNRKRGMLYQLEQDTGKAIVILSNADFAWDEQRYEAEDSRGRKMQLYDDRF